jgi:hypothetical protein
LALGLYFNQIPKKKGGIKMAVNRDYQKDRVENKGIYKDYEDWYDNGPGSENFKRSLIGRTAVMPFPDLSPKKEGPHFPIKVLTEEPYRSKGRGVNKDNDMMRITINISINQWRAFRHKFLRLLHKVRLGGI